MSRRSSVSATINIIIFFSIIIFWFAIVLSTLIAKKKSPVIPAMLTVVIIWGIILILVICNALWSLRPQWSLLTPSRKQMFVVSCIAVSIDPLFLYIPIIDENNKCLGIDNKLRTAALVLRSLTDIPFLFHIIHQIHRVTFMPMVELSWWMSRNEWQKLREERRSKIWRICVHIFIYFLALLPIPQVAVLVIFIRMRGSVVYEKTSIVIYLVLQYLVRAYQIYQSCNKFKRVRRWVKGVFYFFLYILAAHVLGAFWYFCSIQRETSCWQQACKNTTKCKHAYYCDDMNTSTSIAFLNESCPINSSNTTLFDFGIFLDALQSGNTGSINFSTKYFYTFWWGIRNLSNFGTNLEPSSYLWENCFAILICVIGLLLFMYLLGNVQTYIQMETQKTLLIEEEMIKKKCQDIKMWMSRNGLPKDMKKEITEYINKNKVVEKDLDVDVDINFLFSVTPPALRSSFKVHLCIDTLKKVPILYNMSENSLSMMCAYAKPQVYDKNSYVFRKGKLLDKMIIIIKGTIICSDAEELRNSSSSMITEPPSLQKGDFYGEKLLEWEPTIGCSTLTSSQDVQCHTKVEALVFKLKSSKMEDGIKIEDVIKYWRKRQWNPNFTPSLELEDFEVEIERILDEQDTDMYEKSRTTNKEIQDEEFRQKRKIMVKEKAMLNWLSRNGLPENLKREIMMNIKANNVVGINIDAHVDVMYLLSIDLPFHIEISIRKHLCMSTLRRVPVLENMNEDVLISICIYLEPVVYTENNYLVRAGDRLDFMLIILEGILICTDTHSDAATTSSSPLTTRGIVKGDFCGEEILSWASPNNSFSGPAPIWTRDIKCQKKVEAFALTAENLRRVVSDNNIKWDQGFNNCAGASTSGTVEHRLLEQIIQLQGDMLREQLVLVRESMLQLRDDMATQGRRLNDITEFLARSGYPGTPPPTP